MDISDLKNMMEIVFKQAYQLGKEDMLDGVHICSNVLFQQFIENHVSGLGSPHLKSSFLRIADEMNNPATSSEVIHSNIAS